MKLRMILSSPTEKVSEIYQNTEAKIIPLLDESVLIEAECSLERAIYLIGLDSSEGDRSVELRR